MRRHVLGAAAVGFTLAACGGSASARQEYWQRRLSQELPAGTALSEVLAFFDRNRLEHSYDPKSQNVFAIDRDVETRFPVTYSVQIKCSITAEATLRLCAASVFGTGP